jgi:hypothetical protein
VIWCKKKQMMRANDTAVLSRMGVFGWVSDVQSDALVWYSFFFFCFFFFFCSCSRSCFFRRTCLTLKGQCHLPSSDIRNVYDTPSLIKSTIGVALVPLPIYQAAIEWEPPDDTAR